MNNKLVIVILIILVLLAAGNGYYSYTLYEQVNDLNESLAAFKNEQTARIDALSNNLMTLQVQTENGLNDINNRISTAQSDIASVKSDLSAAENVIGAISSQISALNERISNTESSVTSLSDSLIDTIGLYQKVVGSTVKITDDLITNGSGFIYDKSGHVVTAYHVVDGLSPMYVMMYDGTVSPATVIGYCPYSDIAVLKLDVIPSAEPLPLGDSSLLNIGEAVFAIGSPLADYNSPNGLIDTLTAGIVSGINRYENIDGINRSNLIQFDAAVNFGNSGGPLFNSHGEIIGVNDAIVSPTEGSGVSWAISSNKAKRVADAIIATGSFAYPWIGTNIADLSPQDVTDLGLSSANGVFVGSVFTNSPASVAGLQAGDIIIAMDSIPMRNIGELTSYMGEFKSPGDTTTLSVKRGGSTLSLVITVGVRP